jgi:hypothetical protein
MAMEMGVPRPDERTYLLRLLAVGSIAATGSTVRTAGRWRHILANRSPDLARLAIRSLAPNDRPVSVDSELRDGVIGMVRELADASWQETRSALAEFEVRSGASLAPQRQTAHRPHRVKP